MPDVNNWRLDHTGIGVSDIGRSTKFYAAALGPLGLRAIVRITKTFIRSGGYPPGYYAGFVLDPDGNNIEAVFRKA